MKQEVKRAIEQLFQGERGLKLVLDADYLFDQVVWELLACLEVL